MWCNEDKRFDMFTFGLMFNIIFDSDILIEI